MFSFLGILTVAGAMFLFLWYRTVAGLPVKQQPPFARPGVFKWGVPAVSLAVFAAGIYILSEVNRRVAAIAVVAAAAGAFLIIRFDRYSANMRLICDHYREFRRVNPDREDIEALFHTAAWRYPQWSHDRLVELVAGKNIEELLLLMIINDYEINPISDWELYRTLKAKAARIVKAGK